MTLKYGFKLADVLFQLIDVCTDGAVRLQDGISEYEGRAELCYRKEWHTLCDDGVNDGVAMVVCSQLGLPLHGE